MQASEACVLGMRHLGATAEPVNLIEAERAFSAAVRTDQTMCDAWLGLAHVHQAQGNDVADEVWFRAYRSRSRRGEVTDRERLNHVLAVRIGVLGFPLALPVRTADELVVAQSIVYARSGDRGEADHLLTQEIVDESSSYVRLARMLLWRDAQRWDQITAYDWAGLINDLDTRSAAGERGADLLVMLVKFLAIEAAAHLGRGEAMFAELVGLEVEISNDTTRTKEFLWPELMLLKGLVLREMGKPEEANQVLSKLAAYRGGEPRYQRAAASESVRLQVVTNEIIAQRADPWDPDTQPSREEADAEQSREARDRLLEEANNLMAAQVGQPEVKKAIARLRATTQMDRAREEKGTKAAAGRAHHQIFTGAPGTGKTTVARVLGKYFSAYGIVKTDKVVEVGRKDLVGEHIGSTAPKTNKVIDEALDGVLFIDEFYALAQEGLSGGDAFGREAIDTLITRMEDDRDRLVVIVAGYAAPMQRAISTNEGLKTRFTRTIDFPSYNGKELMEIFEGMAVRGGVTTLLEETRQYLAERFEWMAATSWPAHDVWGAAKPGWTVADELGNGRGVRNLLARCEEERDNRLVESGAAEEMSLEEMTTVTLADARAAVTETLAEAAITAEGASS